MAEYCAVPYFNLYKMPESLSFDEGAALQPFGVAVRAMETLVFFKPGDDVAVLGTGPVGLFEALLARAAGAGKVFVTGLTADKKRLELAQQLGFIAVNAEEQSVQDVIMRNTGIVVTDPGIIIEISNRKNRKSLPGKRRRANA